MDTKEKPCDCDDEHHKGHDKSKHKHTGGECVHHDGRRHKIHTS